VRVLIWFATLAFTLIISSRKRYLWRPGG